MTDATPPGTPAPPEDVPTHLLSKEAATAKLNELTKAHNAATGRDTDPFSAGEQHAADALARMVKEPLTAIDAVDVALTGELPSGVMLPFGEEGQTISSQKLATLVEDLREAGLSDGAIKQALLPERHVEDPRWVEAAAQKHGELLGNKEWTKSLLEGDREKFKQLLLLETVLMTPAGVK